MEKVAIALMEGSPSPKSNRFSRVIAESAAHVGYRSDEWRVGRKSGAKIRFGSSFRLMYAIFKISFRH